MTAAANPWAAVVESRTETERDMAVHWVATNVPTASVWPYMRGCIVFGAVVVAHTEEDAVAIRCKFD